MQLLKRKANLFFILAGLLLTILYVWVFKPVYTIGDAPDYIKYAQAIVDNDINKTFLYKSPLYPYMISWIIKIRGIESLPVVVMIIQYFLIFFSSIILYYILKQVLEKKLAFISVMLFFFSLSTVHYGYMVLSEILTLFLFLSCTWFLTKWIELRSDYFLFIVGILFSLLILARFNTLALVVSLLIIIVCVSIINSKKFSIYLPIRYLLFFLLPVIVILNLYSYSNYKKNDLFGLFPTGGSPLISRNSIIATIDGTEMVSDINKPVFDLFLIAVDEYKSIEKNQKESSLLNMWNPDFAKKLYRGFPIYNLAREQLCNYFSIDPENPEPYLSKELRPFYKEIIAQNRYDILMMRFYSLLNSFRSSSGITMSGYNNVNLGNLPAWVIITYKISVICISLFTFISVVIYSGYSIIKREVNNPVLFSLIVLYLSFYFINFFFVIGNDANRYKFPSEPLMFGLFVLFMTKLIQFIRNRILNFNRRINEQK